MDAETPEARALQVVNQIDAIVTEEQGYDNLPTPKIATPIAAAIRAAEAEALERAWKIVDEEARTVDHGYTAVVLRRAANEIRSLKEPTP